MEDENKIAETTENTTAVAEPAQAAPARRTVFPVPPLRP